MVPWIPFSQRVRGPAGSNGSTDISFLSIRNSDALGGGAYACTVESCQERVGLGWKDVQRYVDEVGWTWPGAYRSAYRGGLFCEAKRKASNAADPPRYKGSCSEVLTALPLLTHFAETMLCEHAARMVSMEPPIRCLTALQKVVRALFRAHSVPSADDPSANEVRALILAHFRRFTATYDSSNVKPKQHHATHIAEQGKRLAGHDGAQRTWMNCLVHERKHKTAKSIASQLFATGPIFERGLLERFLAVQMTDLELPAAIEEGIFLRNAFMAGDEILPDLRAVEPEASGALLSSAAYIRGIQVRQHDVLKIGEAHHMTVAIVILFAEVLPRLEGVSVFSWGHLFQLNRSSINLQF